MTKTLSILIGLLLCYGPNINAQSKINTSSSNFKIYNIGNYQIKYAKGAKLDWGQITDLDHKEGESNMDEWRLPSLEELKEIYFYRQILGISSGEFWSTTLCPPFRMYFNCTIDFAKGEEGKRSEGKCFYLLIKSYK